MPSNLIGALKSYSLPGAMTATSEDPVDWATLFAGLRSSVPLTLLLGSREANAGEDEWARRQPRYEQPRNYTVEDLQRDLAHEYPRYVGGAAGEFYKMLQQEQIKQMLKDAKAKENAPRGPRREYPQPTPTQFMRGYAVGGPVLPDHTQPDMSDGGQLLGDPHLYSGGGGVKKTLDEMEAEMIRKGVKTTTRPEMSRRAFFGLPTGSSFPMAKIPTQELEKLRNAPSITEKTTTVTPSPDASKIEETVKKVSETPVSRRTVLKSASGQMLKGVLPDVGVPGVSDIAKSAVETAASAPVGVNAAIPAAILKELGKHGGEYFYWDADYSKYAPKIAKRLGVPEQQVKDVAANIEGVLGSGEGLSIGQDLLSFQPYWLRPSDVAKAAVGIDPAKHGGLSALKPVLRGMKQADPEMYSTFKQGIKDYTMGHNESMFDPWDIPLDQAEELHRQFLRGEKSYKDVSDFFNKYVGLE